MYNKAKVQKQKNYTRQVLPNCSWHPLSVRGTLFTHLETRASFKLIGW